jgi:CrcB protein
VLGTLTRYALALVIPSSGFGTLAANLIAVALAMVLMVFMERRGITELRYLLLPGYCGGLSTFSAVTYEAVAPGEAGLVFLFLNLFLSLIVVVLALKLARRFIRVRG